MLQYPNEIPDLMLLFCDDTLRFYMDPSRTRYSKFQFLCYVETLLHYPSDNPYEQLLRAAVTGEMSEVLDLCLDLNVGHYPALVACLRVLLTKETLALEPEDSMSVLIAAPALLQENKLHQDVLLELIDYYPKHARQLLSLAFIHGLPVNWTCVLQKQIHGDIACLALSREGQQTNKLLEQLYASNNQLTTLLSWLMIDPINAIPQLLARSNTIEIISGLVLHGDPTLISEQAHRLATVEIESVKEPLLLFLDQHTAGRYALSDRPDPLDTVADPINLRQTISKKFPGSTPCLLGGIRTPEKIKYLLMHCKGHAVDYFRLYARLYGYH